MYTGTKLVQQQRYDLILDDEDVSGPPVPRIGLRTGYNDIDWFNRDESLFFDLPQELETSTPQPNFAALARGIRKRLGLGDATGAAVGTAVLGPGIGTAVGDLVPIGGVFKTSDAGPNQTAAQQIAPQVQSNRPNLAAVAAVMARGPGNGPGTGIRTASSAAPWAALLAEIPLSVQQQARAAFPTLNTTGAWEIFGAIPATSVVATVNRLAVYATPTGGIISPPFAAGTGGVMGSPNQPVAGQPMQAGIFGALGTPSTGTLVMGLVGSLLLYKLFGGSSTGRARARIRRYARNPHRRRARARRR